MGKLEVRLVVTARERRAFLTFPWLLYRHDPLWVPPILRERTQRTDPRHGPFFARGEAGFFVAWRRARPVGTICAAHDPALSEARKVPTCVFGFFDYLEQPGVPEALILQAEAWARARGLAQLLGPFDLDYEDGYGVLIDGWTRPPALLCGHSPRYYAPTMARLGFLPEGAPAVALGVDLSQGEPARLLRAAETVRRRGSVSVREVELSRWEDEVTVLLRLLNAALVHLPGYVPWQRERLEPLLTSVREVADPALLLFARAGGEDIGFLAALPDLNQVLLRAGGLRTPWDRLTTYLRLRRSITALTVKSILVHPRYWKTGAAVLMLSELYQRAVARGYQWADLSITSLENPGTVPLAESLGAQVYKKWQVYRRDVALRGS